MGRTPFYRTSIDFEHRNELESVHLLVIEHPIFGFEQTNIELDSGFTRFTDLLIKITRT